MLPVVTMLGMDIGLALGGAIFTERSTAFPDWAARTASRRSENYDIPTVQGMVVFSTSDHHRLQPHRRSALRSLDPRIRLACSDRIRLALLEVTISASPFRTDDGIVKAVDGVTFWSKKEDARDRGRVRLWQERHVPDDHGPEQPGRTTISSGQAMWKGKNLIGDDPEAAARHPRERASR